MRLHRLTLRNFRGTVERSITFAERGVTLVEGPNEAGKSSLAEAVDLLLEFQAHSKARAVRRVQPVGADVPTEITAELTCGPYRFVYAKRFNRDHATTLEIIAPSREQHAGAEAHARVQTILDEHLDQALWRAMRMQQGVPLEQADLTAQTSLAAALDAAAGARIGGERETALFERTRAEYERYHTPTGQPTKGRKERAERVAELRAKADAAADALRAVEEDVARCARASSELGEVADALTEARTRLDEAAQAWTDIEGRQAAVDTLALEAERTAAEHARALAGQERRRELVRRRDVAQGEREEALAAQARMQPALAAAERAVTEAAARVKSARAALAGARAAAHDAERAADATRDREVLGALDDRIARATAARLQAEAAERTLAGPHIDDDALADLEAALVSVHRARAEIDADAPTVRVRRLGPGPITLDGRDLTDDAEGQPVYGRLTVQVGEIAAVSIDAGRSARDRLDAVDRAERGLQALLDRSGVADIAEARAVHRRRADAAADRRRARETLESLLDGDDLAGLTERREALARALDVDPAPSGDLGAAREIAAQARARADECEIAVATAEAAQRDAQARRDALTEAAVDDRLRVALAEQALADADAALGSARAEEDDDALDARAQAAADERLRAAAAHRRGAEELALKDPEGAQAALEEARARVERLAKEHRALEDEIRDLRARLAVRGEEGLHDRLAEAAARLDLTLREHERAERRARAASVLYEEMAAQREQATRAYGAPLRDKIERLGRIVFGDEFSVELTDDLRIARRTLGGATLAVEDLSTGAREQLALLGRLAVAALVAPHGGVPLLLDDALAASDPARLERLSAALRVGGREAQVIVFTCAPDRFRALGEATVVRLS